MAGGDGGLVRFGAILITVQSGRRLTFRSSAWAEELDLGLASGVDGARSAGFPWDRVTVSIRGTGGSADALELSALERTGVVDLPRCMAVRASRT
jgi:hypothetical protein